jgi:hypothetical protein
MSDIRRAGNAAIAIHLVQAAAAAGMQIRGAVPGFEGRDFEEKKSLV